MLLHVRDTIEPRFQVGDDKNSWCTIDVYVLAVAHFQGLSNIKQLWIPFGTGKDFRCIPIDENAYALCPHMAKGLLLFHAFNGCDVTSYFTNRGKKYAWKTWLAWQDITYIVVTISLPCTINIPEDIIRKQERFVVLMYCRTSDDIMSIRHG